jgi:hypothetical protein
MFSLSLLGVEKNHGRNHHDYISGPMPQPNLTAALLLSPGLQKSCGSKGDAIP